MKSDGKSATTTTGGVVTFPLTHGRFLIRWPGQLTESDAKRIASLLAYIQVLLPELVTPVDADGETRSAIHRVNAVSDLAHCDDQAEPRLTQTPAAAGDGDANES